MSKRLAKKGWQFLAGWIALSLIWPAAPLEAAAKNIRVALFVDTGQGYRGTVPAVTLTSDSGFAVTLTGKKDAIAIPKMDEQAIRFRVDEYQVVVAETDDLGEAERIAQRLSQRKADAQILQEERGGSDRYQVVSGSYSDYQSAAAQAKTLAQAAGGTPVVKGPFRLEAGRYASLKEARDWEAAFELSGVPAHTVWVGEKAKTSYAVWIGDEVSKERLSSLKAKAESLFPGFSYREPAVDTYLLLDQEVLTGGGTKTIPFYAFSPQAKVTVAAQKGKPPLIGVEEREQRRYRGKMELSSYKGHLTLVNELPLEEYLYGVVGSEMASGWPLEALKAQAVLARTRALGQGNKYGVANVSDTVMEQAYYGYDREAADIRKAVDATAGEVITYGGKLVEALFYSNAGGMTADGTEVWGNPVPYLRPVDSPDVAPLVDANLWYEVALADGTIGYVRSDLVTLTGESNALGLPLAVVNTDQLNFRSGPSTAYHKVLQTLPVGAQVTIIGQEPEENAYAWTRGPYTPQEITAMINESQKRNKAEQFRHDISSLRVTARGPSGRVLAMEADGIPLTVSSPDAIRSIFAQGGSVLRSTKFEVEEMGSYTVLGANGRKVTYPRSAGLYAIGSSLVPEAPNGYAEAFLIYSGAGAWRTATKEQAFLLRGNGFGHGLGVSQFGAKAMAEDGYDYRQILQHYYYGVEIGR
ncbi:SpoIID/LytB domain-containing protein [Brevibacillus sp. SYP-B805]|uniref:SpoIID/LytB domain-containing protein n=1 Tax=Brevibacillus sp. SYP-B805 TaxID=1578199 RepID=UPI0013EA5D06|nr:SpoIID/LytB domain-containing protein [Brevibacillus sp. SYP-B805]NGQ94269.1 SpoIID/LytB domain-containing protein [Brevibacillus sp. SYP-B805]